jgi:hypothetical protein
MTFGIGPEALMMAERLSSNRKVAPKWPRQNSKKIKNEAVSANRKVK